MDEPQAERTTSKEAGRALTAAIWCAAAPLAFGILMCIGWWWRREWKFAFMGLADIGVGLIAFIAGMILLRSAVKQVRLQPQPPDESFGRRRTVALFLLCGNFPAMIGCLMFAISLSHPLVIIHNESGKALSQLKLATSYPGFAPIIVGDLKPGESRRVETRPFGNGEASLQGLIDGQPLDHPLSTFDIGPVRVDVRVLPGGKVESPQLVDPERGN